MRKLFVSLVLMLVMFILPSFVSADTTYLLTATTPAGNLSGFSLSYADADHNQRFTLDELVPDSFSGMTYITGNPNYSGLWKEIAAVPVYDSVVSPYTNGPGYYGYETYWYFTSGPVSGYGLLAPSSTWSYNQTAVPLPPSVLLLGSGLLGLAAVGWRRRKPSVLKEIAGLPGKSNSGFSC